MNEVDVHFMSGELNLTKLVKEIKKKYGKFNINKLKLIPQLDWSDCYYPGDNPSVTTIWRYHNE